MKNKRLVKMFGMSTMALSMMLAGVSAIITPLTTPVMAAEANFFTNGGIADLGNGPSTITVNPNNGEQTMIGKKFEVYKLFNAENSKDLESINYTFNPAYKAALQKVVGAKLNKSADSITEYEVIDYIQSLNNHKVEGAHADQELEGRYSDFRYFVEELRDVMVEMNMDGDLVNVVDTNEAGGIEITGLEFGYYIVDEVSDSEGTHSASSLCMVDTANPEATVNLKSDYPSVIKKIEEDDLGVGWNDIADYEIGQTVPYKYETYVPNMNGYHTYYFAFHDKMDSALTFNPSSVQIQIISENKTYTLGSNEFRVSEFENGDTFTIEIDDLKRIVDKEFPEGMNADKENIYGQKVVLKYNATMNDLAADDTGRPGFENSVRLEFSNNPDSDGTGETGFTPWDSTVCFTYELNVTKINDHDKVLEGAKFRLYSDEACTQEVYVKANPKGGYNVINRDILGGNDHTGGVASSEAVEMVSNAEGKFIIFGLDQGTYWLKETDAPDGYRQLLDPIELTLTPTFTSERQEYVAGEGATEKILQALAGTAHITSFYDGLFGNEDQVLETNVENGSANLTVVNKVGSKLPVTGSNLTIIMLGAGTALMALAADKQRKTAKAVEE